MGDEPPPGVAANLWQDHTSHIGPRSYVTTHCHWHWSLDSALEKSKNIKRLNISPANLWQDHTSHIAIGIGSRSYVTTTKVYKSNVQKYTIGKSKKENKY